MKKLTAMIRPNRLDAVKDSLIEAGALGMNLTNLQRLGRPQAAVEMYRGQEHRQDFQGQVKVEMVVEDDQVDRMIAAIVRAAQTGEVGDGRIFVADISSITRIRTGEAGPEAL